MSERKYDVAVLTYRVAVFASVNLDTREVTEVRIAHETIALDEKEPVVIERSEKSVGKPEAELAIEIAESEDWPAWEFV